jgi:UDP-N-acetylglucosamine acyltransferase
MPVHPLALISPEAILGENVQIGPLSVIEAGVKIGSGCVLESHVTIKCGTTLGENCRVSDGAVLGGLPQHVHVPEHPGTVVIGAGSTFRENVTVHRALEAEHQTTIGDHCLLMANSHVAHDCQLGNQVILTNNAMLAGHVIVGDRAYVSGGAGVHQFCRIGPLAMIGGLAHIVKDVPPFVTIDGQSNYVVGLNQVGLRRAGYDQRTVQQVKEAYRLIYRSGLLWAEILRRLQEEFREGLAAEFYPFLAATKRGIIPERRLPPGATLKLRPMEEPQQELRHKAG